MYLHHIELYIKLNQATKGTGQPQRGWPVPFFDEMGCP